MDIKILVTVEPVELTIPEGASDEAVREMLDSYFGEQEWKTWKYADEWRN